MTELLRSDDSLLVREVDDELLVLDTRSNRVHQLNATASAIFKLARSGAAAQAIADSLVTQYAIDDAAALKDVAETVDKLRSLGLL